MKVYVLGAGSIGSLFGALLARAGNDVTLIGREEQVRAIKRTGCTFRALRSSRSIRKRASTRPTSPRSF